jgi:hypothetical protein
MDCSFRPKCSSICTGRTSVCKQACHATRDIKWQMHPGCCSQLCNRVADVADGCAVPCCCYRLGGKMRCRPPARLPWLVALLQLALLVLLPRPAAGQGECCRAAGAEPLDATTHGPLPARALDPTACPARCRRRSLPGAHHAQHHGAVRGPEPGGGAAVRRGGRAAARPQLLHQLHPDRGHPRGKVGPPAGRRCEWKRPLPCEQNLRRRGSSSRRRTAAP